MERKTISEFDAVTSVDDADLMLVVQGGVYKQATALQVAGGGSTLYATAAQGAKADTALQPGDIGDTVQGYSAILDATTASFTTADETKLDGIEALADVTDTANVTAAGALMDSEVTNLAAVKAFDPTDYATAAQGALADSALQSSDIGSSIQAYSAVLDATTASYTTAEETKLAGVEAGATGDQTGAEIKVAYEAEANTNAFTDALLSKLNGIEASADVTDTANVTAAGALMDSEVTNLAQVKAFDTTDYATAAQGSTADSALQPTGQSTLTGGFDSDEEALGTITSGTVTPEVDGAGEENFKTLTNNGAFTLAPPSTSSATTIRIRVINAASAGAITTSGFDAVFDPDSYATTNAKEYWFYIDHDSTRSTLTIREIV